MGDVEAARFATEVPSEGSARLPASTAARNAARPAARSSKEGGGEMADREKGPKLQHPILTPVPGEGRSAESLVVEAYEHVVAGYERALTVVGLPQVEVESLRACLRAALELAQSPHVAPVRSPGEGSRRSLAAG